MKRAIELHDKSHLLAKMAALKTDMLCVAEQLNSRGNQANSEELAGAANILQSWIEGISDEMARKKKS